MSLVTPDLQKLENLLKSATNARQRKMYQSLLDKAVRQNAKYQKLASKSEVESKIDAPTKVPVPDKQRQKKQTSKQVKEALDSTTNKKADSKKSLIVEGEEVNLKQGKGKKGKKVEEPSQAKGTGIFQGVGLIKCAPQLREDKLYINIDGQEYELRRGQQGGSRRHYYQLKQDIEENGTREVWMRVYPKIAHHQTKRTIAYFFTLVKVFSDKSQAENQHEGFVIRGIWHYVLYCSKPVISIYRNIEMLGSYKQLSSLAAKKAFARPQDFPVVWSAPVEPYRYNSKLEDDKQMPLYFVQVRAVFKDGRFEVTEMLEEPTLDIPKYVKPPKKQKG